MPSTRDSLNRAHDAATTTTPPFKTSGTATAAELGRITVNLGADLFHSFKVATVANRTSMTDVIRAFVSQWVAENPPPGS